MLSLHTLLILLLLFTYVNAFFRLAPPVLRQERADPIIAAGKQSSHVHTFVGASGVGKTTSYEQLRASDCTTSPVKQDLR